MPVTDGYAPGLCDGRPTTLVSQSALPKEHDVAFGFPRRSSGCLPFMDTSAGRVSLVSTLDGLYELPFVAVTPLALPLGAGVSASAVPAVSLLPSHEPVGAASRSNSASAYTLTHFCRGHQHHRGISDLLGTLVTGLLLILSALLPLELDFCQDCALHKVVSAPRGKPIDNCRYHALSHLITDILGKMSGPSGMHQWALGVTDHFTSYTWLEFMHSKSQVLAMLERIIHRLKFWFAQLYPTEQSTCVLRADRDSVYTWDVCIQFRTTFCFGRHSASDDNPLCSLDGKMERQWRTFTGFAQAMMSHACLPRHLWTSAFACVVHIRNRVISHGAGTDGGIPRWWHSSSTSIW
eukprot:scaffold53198_cov27-Prasinocladus_malaysianus.AAC.3